MTGQVHLQVDESIGWIVFDNPDRHNAVTGPMLAELLAALERAGQDGHIRVIGLRGAGDRAFVSGADITAFGSAAGVESGPRIEDLVEAMSRLAKPVVAVLRGHCLGAGVLLALAADWRLAGDDLRMGIPAARLGVAYPRVGVGQLFEVAGPAVASEMLATGLPYGPADALRHGLVNRVLPADSLFGEARQILMTVAGNAPLTLLASKRTVVSLRRPADPAAAQVADEAMAACFRSEDFREGQRAFVEKRPPEFTGR